MHALRLSALLVFAAALHAADYPLSPDSKRQSGVPEGRLEQFEHTSQIYPGSIRDVWVYVPAQYDGSEPAAVMIFNGPAYKALDARSLPAGPLVCFLQLPVSRTTETEEG